MTGRKPDPEEEEADDEVEELDFDFTFAKTFASHWDDEGVPERDEEYEERVQSWRPGRKREKK